MLRVTTAIALLIASQTCADKCDKTKIGTDFYKRQLIATIDGYPTGLAVDPRTEHIFFILHKKNYTKGLHLLKHGSLGVKEITLSDDIVAQCVGIDRDNIYFGTNQGLIVYDYNHVTERAIGDDDVKSIFIDKNNEMLISIGTNREIFKFVNGSAAVKRFDKIPKAYNFVLDTKGNVFYEYMDGKLYFLSNDLFEPVQYKGFSRELKYVLKLNNNDEAIVAVKGSLYKLTTESILPIKIGHLGFRITGMEFDARNNIIVGTKGKIYRYKPLDGNDPCPSEDYFMSSI
ncbi:unnamed protein product, partial [Brenthis ino]